MFYEGLPALLASCEFTPREIVMQALQNKMSMMQKFELNFSPYQYNIF